MMETFAEAWVAANTQTPLTEAAAAAADHVSLLFYLFFCLFPLSLAFAFSLPLLRTPITIATESLSHTLFPHCRQSFSCKTLIR